METISNENLNSFSVSKDPISNSVTCTSGRNFSDMKVDENTLNYILNVEHTGSNRSKSCDTSPRNSMHTPGLTIVPIDDDEFAYISTDNTLKISYEKIPLNPNIKPSDINLPRGPHFKLVHNRCSSFQSFNISHVADNEEDGFNLRLSPSLRKVSRFSKDLCNSTRSSPEVPFHPGYHSMGSTPLDISAYFNTTHRSPDNASKDKNASIFQPNGLFIKKDHPIFTQQYSKKVFVGGLPRDISIDLLKKQFSSFGELFVDWPNREIEQVPPNGFAFLHFENVNGVGKLNELVCGSKNKYYISSPNVKTKEVEIKFWKMSDCEYISTQGNLINTAYTVFVGALPRITTASELANYMERNFGKVVYTAIDVDLLYGYPKGAGRVTFKTKEGYEKALDSHYIEMDVSTNGKKKRIEIKPFLLLEQRCDICCSQNLNNGQFANKYCYICSSFVCDSCVSRPCCFNKAPHSQYDPV